MSSCVPSVCRGVRDGPPGSGSLRGGDPCLVELRSLCGGPEGKGLKTMLALQPGNRAGTTSRTSAMRGDGRFKNTAEGSDRRLRMQNSQDGGCGSNNEGVEGPGITRRTMPTNLGTTLGILWQGCGVLRLWMLPKTQQ